MLNYALAYQKGHKGNGGLSVPLSPSAAVPVYREPVPHIYRQVMWVQG